MKEDHPDSIEFVMQTVVMMAAFCLREIAAGAGTPFVDNRMIFEAIGFGLKRLLDTNSVRRALTEDEIRQFKAKLLAQRVFSVELPSFQFRSFDDVFELKQRLDAELAAFDERMFEFAQRLSGLPWEPGFLSSLEDFVTTRIQPEINAIRRKAVSSIADRALGAIETVGAVAGLKIALHQLNPGVWDYLASGGMIVTLVDALKRLGGEGAGAAAKSGLSLLIKLK